MKKYIFYSILANLFFPLVMIYPLFFLGLFIPNPLFAVTKITGTDATGFGLAFLIWLIVGGVIGFIIYNIRQIYYSKKNLALPPFGFSGLLLSILIQLLFTFAISYI